MPNINCTSTSNGCTSPTSTKLRVSGETYRMRTECQPDCDVARLLLGRWLTSWSECVATCLDSGDLLGPDMEVEFTVVEGAPSLEQLRWLLAQAPDLHVAAESLMVAKKYTGDRCRFDCSLLDPPDDETLRTLQASLRRGLDCMDDTRERVEEAAESVTAVFGDDMARIARIAKRHASFLMEFNRSGTTKQSPERAQYLGVVSALQHVRGASPTAEEVRLVRKALFPRRTPK